MRTLWASRSKGQLVFLLLSLFALMGPATTLSAQQNHPEPNPFKMPRRAKSYWQRVAPPPSEPEETLGDGICANRVGKPERSRVRSRVQAGFLLAKEAEKPRRKKKEESGSPIPRFQIWREAPAKTKNCRKLRTSLTQETGQQSIPNDALVAPRPREGYAH